MLGEMGMGRAGLVNETRIWVKGQRVIYLHINLEDEDGAGTVNLQWDTAIVIAIAR